MNKLFVAWRSGGLDQGAWGPVGMLCYSENLYRFCYTRGALKLEDFRAFPGMDDFEQVYESEQLFPLFANRLLSRNRPEYDSYLRWGGISLEKMPDPIAVDMAILGITGGIRQTDSIEVFPCPVRSEYGGYENKFFLHGIHRMPSVAIERINRLNENENLFSMLDLFNPAHPWAVAVRTDAEPMLIGYVPRYLAMDVHELLHECDSENISCVVERLNLDAPLQQRVLCRMNSCWPTAFNPCSDDAFLPIPAQVPGLCNPVS